MTEVLLGEARAGAVWAPPVEVPRREGGPPWEMATATGTTAAEASLPLRAPVSEDAALCNGTDGKRLVLTATFASYGGVRVKGQGVSRSRGGRGGEGVWVWRVGAARGAG
jgi:hypothetical protein